MTEDATLFFQPPADGADPGVESPAPVRNLILRLHADLRAAPATLQPAVGAAWALYGLEQAGGIDLATCIRLVPAIDAALDAGDAEAEAARHLIDTLRHAAPVPAPTVPPGF